jgi:hypothetical protein
VLHYVAFLTMVHPGNGYSNTTNIGTVKRLVKKILKHWNKESISYTIFCPSNFSTGFSFHLSLVFFSSNSTLKFYIHYGFTNFVFNFVGCVQLHGYVMGLQLVCTVISGCIQKVKHQLLPAKHSLEPQLVGCLLLAILSCCEVHPNYF